MNVRNYTTKTVTLPDDHWAALEREALLALMPVDKLMAHAVRLMQLDAAQARAGLSRAYVDDNGQVQREAPVGLPGETTAPAVAGPLEASVGQGEFEFCWLVELFHRGGNSVGRYHTGLTDLHNQSRSTDDPNQAKRYLKADGERMADALNLHMMSCEWRAVEHGFATPRDDDALRGALILSARRVKVLEEALRRLTLAARTSGGWEPDADLREACERAERLLPDVTPNAELRGAEPLGEASP